MKAVVMMVVVVVVVVVVTVVVGTEGLVMLWVSRDGVADGGDCGSGDDGSGIELGAYVRWWWWWWWWW